ncbi:endonuclease/exonuclease/phosphatase family protein [Nemania sp. FL0031]|nr:endonuclease/exonuclease/phosphatase family protein [Nemania sp. FL0031]
MDKRVQKAIQESVALKKNPDIAPWKLDEPWPQPLYAWDAEEEAWKHTTPGKSSTPERSLRSSSSISSLAFYSWNIDFMLPLAESRMEAALAHLETLLSDPPLTTAIVINLQECIPSDLATLSRQPWIRERFYMTDFDTSNWASGLYGVTTLVDRRLSVVSCFRVHYAQTQQERNALFVDVAIPIPIPIPASTARVEPHYHILRLGNSHLESLAADPPLRPAQVRVMSKYMRAADEEVSSAITMGDFNAIQPFDRTLHADNGLRDAYLELGGREESPGGHTWGPQALRELRERFGGSRMDKAYFCGSDLKILSFERFGADVEIAADRKKQRDQLLALGFEKAWVTDHLGIRAVFSWKNSERL